MRQFVLQRARQLRVHAGQSLHRNTNPPIVERARPRRRPRDVHKCFFRVQDHSNRFGGSVIQLGLNGGKVYFQRAEHVPRQVRRGGAIVLQFEVSAFVLFVAFFLFLVAQGSFERPLQFLVWAQHQRMFPFRNRLIELV